MFNSTNISATFNASSIPNSKAFGYGSIDFAGVSVNYSVYPSQYGLGIMVSLPSRPKIKNGVQERDGQGVEVLRQRRAADGPHVADHVPHRGAAPAGDAARFRGAGVHLAGLSTQARYGGLAEPVGRAVRRADPRLPVHRDVLPRARRT